MTAWLILLSGCLVYPGIPAGEGLSCVDSEDCEPGLVCIVDMEEYLGWEDDYFNTCRVPCKENTDCRFKETRSCYWCEMGGTPSDFCVHTSCE
jgi:hypothetical protein